jgi:Spy/CpxP family protein refolding chaperone
VFSFRSLLVPAALATALAVPAIGFAQVQPAAAQNQQQSGSQRHHGGFGFLKDLNLTPQQQTQIDQIRQQYRQAHPKGSARDPQAMKDMRDKMMAVLTPAQQAQLKADMQKRRAEYGQGRNGNGRNSFPQPSPSPVV